MTFEIVYQNKGDVVQKKIGTIHLLVAPINLVWTLAWGGMGLLLMLMMSRYLAFLGMPVGGVLFIVVAYLLLLLYLKLVCEVPVAMSVDETVALLKQAGFHQKEDGSMVRRFMGIPSDKVRVLSEGGACRLRGSRQLLIKAVNGLKKVM